MLKKLVQLYFPLEHSAITTNPTLQEPDLFSQASSPTSLSLSMAPIADPLNTQMTKLPSLTSENAAGYANIYNSVWLAA